MEELTPGTKVSPCFHLTCYGCKNSHDAYSDMQFGTEMTKCRSLKDKLVPMVHPTIDCKLYEPVEISQENRDFMPEYEYTRKE